MLLRFAVENHLSICERQVLWFASKDIAGTTETYPLTDFRTRKGDNVDLGYLQGCYWALPIDDPAPYLPGAC